MPAKILGILRNSRAIGCYELTQVRAGEQGVQLSVVILVWLLPFSPWL